MALLGSFVPGRIAAPLHVFDAQESLGDPLACDWLAHTGTRAQSTWQPLPGSHENIILLDRNVALIAGVLRGRSYGPDRFR